MAKHKQSEPPDVDRLFFATADRREAHLFEATLTEHGRVHVEARDALHELWDELQHARPSPRSGKDGHSYASEGREDEERVHRFAKAFSHWLEDQLKAHDLERLHVFLARDLLGEYRGVAKGRLERCVRPHALNLAHLGPGELAEQRSVADRVRSEFSSARRPPAPSRSEAVQSIAEGGHLAPWITAEHATLRGLIDRLRAEIDRLRGERGSHAPGQLVPLLTEFDDHLRAHFELEEQSGFLVGNTSADAKALISQHRDMERRLDRALDAARRSSEGDVGLSDSFVNGLRDLLGLLAEHEAAENAIVARHAER